MYFRSNKTVEFRPVEKLHDIQCSYHTEPDRPTHLCRVRDSSLLYLNQNKLAYGVKWIDCQDGTPKPLQEKLSITIKGHKKFLDMCCIRESDRDLLITAMDGFKGTGTLSKIILH